MKLKVGDAVHLDTTGVVTRVELHYFNVKFDGSETENSFRPSDAPKFKVVEPPPKVGDLVENDITSARPTRTRGILLHIFDPPLTTPGGFGSTGIILKKNGFAVNVYTTIRKVSK